MIKILGMEAKADYAAGNLSGGQKRKLSVGIAIIGDSKVCATYTLCSRNKISVLLIKKKKNMKKDKCKLTISGFFAGYYTG